MGSAQLRIGRPSGFKPVPGMSTSTGTMGVGPGGLSKLSGLLGGVPFSGGLGSVYTPLTGASASDSSADANADHSNVVILNNLPLGLDKEQIRELVSAFGDLSAFNVIRDPLEDSQSAVFKYAVETIAEQAISGLGELTLGDQKLSAQLVPTNMVDILLQPADISRNDAIAIESKEGSAEIKVEEMPWSRDKIILRSHPPSRVLCFYGMTAEDDLKLDDYFDEMVEDIAQEFNTCAAVSSIEVPRTGEAKGLVFIYLASIEGAVKCRRELEGRTFNGNETSAVYFPEDFFLQKKLLLPAGYTLPKQKPDDDID